MTNKFARDIDVPTNNTQDTELFELCKQVSEATGWRDTLDYFYHSNAEGRFATQRSSYVEARPGSWWFEGINAWPLYNSDYLLDKLPNDTHVYTTLKGATAHVVVRGDTFFGDGGLDRTREKAPLKALLKLTLALHKEGLL